MRPELSLTPINVKNCRLFFLGTITNLTPYLDYHSAIALLHSGDNQVHQKDKQHCLDRQSPIRYHTFTDKYAVIMIHCSGVGVIVTINNYYRCMHT